MADISPLAGLTRFKSLDIYSNRITDIGRIIEVAQPETKLRLSGPSFEKLADLVNLQDLDLLGSNIVDISMLAELTNLLNLNPGPIIR